MDRVERSWKEMLITVVSCAHRGDTVVVGSERERLWATEALKQMKLFDHVVIRLDEKVVLPHLERR